jgi:hypothetical protein
MEQIAKAPNANPPDVSKKKSPGKRGRPRGRCIIEAGKS